MIYILNHNTSYKHSKFSARCETSRVVVPTTNTKALLNKHPSMNSCIPGGVLKHKRHTFEQSKPLLCWRYDLTFFNLGSFFFGILKALHTCWYFAKNNKSIVFISTDNPSDTGVCAGIDTLTQKYTREFLPRIAGSHPGDTPGWEPSIQTQLRNSNNVVRTAVKTVKSNNTVKRLSGTQKLNRFAKHNNNTCKFVENDPRKKTNLNHSYNELLYNNNSKKHEYSVSNNRATPAGISPTAVRRRIDHLKSTVLTELKNLIHFSGVVEQTAGVLKTENAPQNVSVAHISYHKSDGLLYKAASRRLCASFSRTKAPFFSNAKSSFRELFSHLSDPEKTLSRLLFPAAQHSLFKMGVLDLNKRCLLKPISDMPDFLNENTFSAEKKSAQHFQPKSAPTHMESVLIKPVFSVTASRFDKPLSSRDNLPREKEKSLSKLSVDETNTEFAYDRVRTRPGGTDLAIKKKRTYAFHVHYNGVLPSIMERQNKNKYKKKNQKHHQSIKVTTYKKRQFYAGAAPYKHLDPDIITGRGRGGWGAGESRGVFKEFIIAKHTQKRNAYEQHDFYGTVMNQQAHQAAKRFAYSPYIQNADLVFFVNPDKNPGLASQIKKLGIPSIGIVSGLKSSTYRKQPTHSNLHDSVTYPIVGNSDNAAFVLMVVRIFVKLIQKADRPVYPCERFPRALSTSRASRVPFGTHSLTHTTDK